MNSSRQRAGSARLARRGARSRGKSAGVAAPSLKLAARAPVHVLILFPHPGEVSYWFFESICRILENPLPGVKVTWQAMESGPFLVKARNELLKHFLMKSTADYAWFIDTDQHVDLDVLPKLLDAGKDVISPVVYGMVEGERFLPFHFNTGVEVSDDGELTGRQKMLRNVDATELESSPGNLLQVYSVGMACTLIKREVVEKLGIDVPRMWPFGHESYQDQLLGEDVTFCHRANEAGFKVWVRKDARIGHWKHFLI